MDHHFFDGDVYIILTIFRVAEGNDVKCKNLTFAFAAPYLNRGERLTSSSSSATGACPEVIKTDGPLLSA